MDLFGRGRDMPRTSIPKEKRQAIREARKLIKQAVDLNANEAETRRRVERIFEQVMGYDVFKHLSRERAVKGSAETEHVDFSIQLEPGVDAKPLVMVELKKVGSDLAKKHLKQVTSYAINAGCEWILLTNGREWRVYHVEFGQPPEIELLDSWNLLEDDISDLVSKFDLISFSSIRKSSLDKMWQRVKVFAPDQLLEAIMSEDALRSIRRYLHRSTGVRLKYEEIYTGISKLLNERAAQVLSNIEPPKSKRRKRRGRKNQKESNIEKEQIGQPIIDDNNLTI